MSLLANITTQLTEAIGANGLWIKGFEYIHDSDFSRIPDILLHNNESHVAM